MSAPAGTEISPEFADTYGAFWGARWPELWSALQKHELRVARASAFSSSSLTLTPWRNEVPGLFQVESGSAPLSAQRGPEGLLSYYVMDPASVFVARALDVQPDDQVLDLCAAPGGKSLILIEALAAGRGEIILNEPSMARRERLKKVVQQYVDRGTRDRVRLSGKDGGKFALSHAETFDRILVDAPCSGEAHLLENAEERKRWSPQKSKGLAQRQYALLTAALEALKPGGEVVYSTCTISKWENEGVVEKFLRKKGERIESVGVSVPEGGENVMTEAGGRGVYFLPDRAGFGPIFMAKFRKKMMENDRD